MAMADSSGLPIACWIESASPHEVKLVEDTIDHKFTKRNPKRIIGDLAYDSDKLDFRLKKRKIKMIAPHKINRKKKPTQDGRVLRRYRRRWKIERLFAWLHNYRRILNRFEYHWENYLSFVQIPVLPGLHVHLLSIKARIDLRD